MDFLISTMAIHFYINPYFDDYVSFLQLKQIQVQHGYTILMVMPLIWIQFQGTHGFPFKRLKDWMIPGISPRWQCNRMGRRCVSRPDPKTYQVINEGCVATCWKQGPINKKDVFPNRNKDGNFFVGVFFPNIIVCFIFLQEISYVEWPWCTWCCLEAFIVSVRPRVFAPCWKGWLVSFSWEFGNQKRWKRDWAVIKNPGCSCYNMGFYYPTYMGIKIDQCKDPS